MLITKRKIQLLLLLEVILLTVDLGSKYIAKKFLHPLYNSGISFSLFSRQNLTEILMVLTIIVGILIFGAVLYVAVYIRKVNLYALVGAVAISSGSLGNGFDRLINLSSIDIHKAVVTDFIYYPDLFTGNIADIFIVVGCIFLIGFSLRNKNKL